MKETVVSTTVEQTTTPETPAVEKLVKIELRVIRHSDDGKSWFGYKGLTKAGKWADLRFTKEVTKTPQHPCFVFIKPENVNQESANAVKYPKIWVKAIERTSALLYDRAVEDFQPSKRPSAQDLFETEE